MQMSAKAYAKLNLTLDILGKREDGYHQIRTMMQSVSLCDTVTVTIDGRGGISLNVSEKSIPCDARNTAYQAADLFFAATGIPNDGVAIKIEKRIPHGAGLGGGSADAAAVLQLLNAVYKTGLTGRALCDIGLQVGADVPFCIVGGTMLGESIGEILSPLPDLALCCFVLVKPAVSISTADAYRRCDEVEPARRPDTDKAVDALRARDLTALGGQLCNVFEEVVALPELKEIQLIMRSEGALGACMSGSGSTVFGMFDQAAAAEHCKKRLEEKFEDVFLCEPVPCGVALI